VEEKRAFSISHLYNLTKTTVIVISILIGLWGALQIHRVFNTDYSLESLKSLQESCKKINPEIESDCTLTFLGDRHNLEEAGYRNIGIAFLLPISFYIGRRIYKYLFPKKDVKS